MFRIITDSGADFRETRARELGLDIAHLKITFPDEVLIQHEEDDVTRFFDKLAVAVDLPVTSQPSPQDFMDLYNKYPEDEILVLTLSGGLSGTWNSAELAKSMLTAPDRVTIIDTQQATLSQNVLVAEAVRLRQAGATCSEAADVIRELSQRCTIIGLIDTLKYLKKGGRIPKSLAAIGSVLNLKPLVELKDGILVTAGKARGHKAGIKMLFDQVESYGIDPDYLVFLGYTGDRHDIEEIILKFKTDYPKVRYEVARIGGIIGTHIGAGSVGVGFIKQKK